MSSPTHRTRTLATISGLALLMGAGIAGAPQAAHAQSQQQSAAQHDINLPAGPLEASLVRVADVTGVQLVYSAQVSSGVRAPAVRGRMDAATAFARVLAGTGLTYRFIDARTVTIERVPQSIEDDGSRVLGPVRVEGAQSAYAGGAARGDGIAQLGGVRGGQDEEAAGYRPYVATVGAGVQTALEDIPRSISVLTNEQIEQQDIRTIGDALERLPGVTVVESGGTGMSLGKGASVTSRGFTLNRVQLDGGAPLPLNLIGNGGLDLTGYERLELVRGPNGLFSGAGSPGGSLNLVRKRPDEVERTRITATLGSFDRQRIELDYSTPQLLNSTLAFRGVVSAETREYFYDNAETSSFTVYGVLDAPLGDRARLEVGGQHSIREENSPYSGVLRYLDGPLFDVFGPNGNLSPAWAYHDTTQTELFARLFIDIMDDVDLQVGLDLQSSEEQRLAATYSAGFVSSGIRIRNSFFGASFDDFERVTYSANFRLTGKRHWLSLDHSFYVGGDVSEYDLGKGNQQFGGTVSTLTVPAFRSAVTSYTPALAGFSSFSHVGGTTLNSSLVLGDVVSWRDRVELTVGARLDRYERSNSYVGRESTSGLPESLVLQETTGGEESFENEWTPTWSLAVKPLQGLTIYGTAANGKEEQTVSLFRTDGTTLPPARYENLEGGVKYARSGWLATLAYYDLQQFDVPIPVDGSSCLPSNTFSTPCYEVGGDQQTTGWDFELSGELMTGLNVSASFTHQEINSKSTGDRLSTFSPVDSANLLIDWRPAHLPRWGFRTGARYRSEVYRKGTQTLVDPVTGAPTGTQTYEFAEDPFVVVDAGARYQLTDNVSLDLYVENLFDEEYLSTIQTPTGRSFPGAPRTLTFTLRWVDEGARRGGGDGLAPFGDPADWYAAFDLGAFGLGDFEADAEGLSQDGATPIHWTFETENESLSTSARIGYRLSPRLRTEIEAAHRTAEFGDIGGGDAAPFGVCGVANAYYGLPFDCDNAFGDISAWSLMLNGLYDFGEEAQAIRPFVGAGVGVLASSVDFSGALEGVGSTEWLHNDFGFPYFDQDRMLQGGIRGDSRTFSVAVQILAGVSWELTSQATIDATYRYFNAPEISWDSYNLDETSAYGVPSLMNSRIGDFNAPFESHTLSIGLRWAFGAR